MLLLAAADGEPEDKPEARMTNTEMPENNKIEIEWPTHEMPKTWNTER